MVICPPDPTRPVTLPTWFTSGTDDPALFCTSIGPLVAFR